MREKEKERERERKREKERERRRVEPAQPVVVGGMKTVSLERTDQGGVDQKLVKYLCQSSNCVKKMPSQFSFEIL